MGKLLGAVSMCAWHRLAVKRYVAVSLSKVRVALLHPHQILIEIVRHLLATLVQSVQIVIVRIATFEMRQPNRLARSRVKTQHVVNRVHALIPVKTVVLKMLIALRRIEHPARNLPTLCRLVVGHRAGSLSPLATLIFGILAVSRLIHLAPVIVCHVSR